MSFNALGGGMKIKIWGCRGSLPTPGNETLRYGGNTTCLEIRSSTGHMVIVDAGSGLRNLGKSILKDNAVTEVHFLFTHSHWDHLMGFPFFVPAYFSKYTMKFCCGMHAQETIRDFLSHQMESPYFPVDFSQLRATIVFECSNPHHAVCNCRCNGLEISAVPLNHPNGGYGYKFVENGKTFIFIPDNEFGFAHENGPTREDYIALFRDVDLLIHDAQYTEDEYRHTRGWGHSTYADATDVAIASNVKSFGMFHHDPDRTDADLDQQVEFCRQRIRAEKSTVHCFAVAEGMEIEL